MQVRQRCANGHHTLIFNINETGTNVGTNKSTVNWSIQLQADAGWGFSTIGSTLVATVNGTQVYNQYAQRSCGAGQTVTWASGTTEVTHNSDGSKKASFSCSYTQSSSASYTPGNASLSGTITLTTIPRATTCPNLSGDIESTYNIALNPASSSFSHSLRVTFGSINQYVNASGNLQSAEYKFANKNINFTIPASFYQQISGKNGNGTLTLVTYNGNTNIGTKTGTLTAHCLESRCRPSISGTAVDVNATTIALTGNANKIVKGYSNVKLTLTLKAATKSGDKKSTISSRSVDGTTFSGTTVTLNKVSKKDFIVTVTNSRGYSYSATISASGGLVDYFSPNMNVNFYRTEQTGSNIKLSYSGTFFNQNFGSVVNTITLKWYWKKSTESTWTTGGTITPTLNGNNISSATIDCGDTYDYQTNYRFKLETIDKLADGNRENDVLAGVPNHSYGKDWFQHHTDVYYETAIPNRKVKDIDLNALTKDTDNGLYQIATSINNYENLPDDIQYGILAVLNPTGGTGGAFQSLQVCIGTSNIIKHRTRVNDRWAEWQTASLISDSGTANGGMWIKFFDGTMILTQRVQFDNVNINYQWGSVYTNNDDVRKLPNFAQAFTQIPAVNMTVQPVNSSGRDTWLTTCQNNGVTTVNNAGGFQLARGTAATANVIINVIAIGKWK